VSRGIPDCNGGGKRLAYLIVAVKLSDRGARVRRVKWVELSCMLCGEWVATLEGETLLRPRSPGSARLNGNRVACGRCGGALTSTDQGEKVHFV
jgi:hypothetical protein